MNSEVYLTVGQSTQLQMGFMAQSVLIYNNSTGWVSINDNFVAAPNQQCVVQVTPASQTPRVALSLQGPPLTAALSAGQGQCYLVFQSDPAPANAGIQTPANNYSPDSTLFNKVGPTVGSTFTLTVPNGIHSLAFVVGGVGNATISLSGNQSNFTYFNAVLQNANAAPAEAEFLDSIDSTLNLAIVGASVGAQVMVIGRPFVSDLVTITGQPISVSGTVTANQGGAWTVTTTPTNGTWTTGDGSGTIAVGGTRQQIFAAAATRIKLLIVNDDVASSFSPTEPLWVNFGVNAVQSQPSIPIPPGGNLLIDGPGCPGDRVDVIAATSGHPFTAKQWT